jgi:two-component system phosphate regulon sensor histidine kinase PhoR
VIKPDGTVIADSENDPVQMEDHSTRPEINTALKGETGDSIRFSTTMGENMLYLALPIKKAGATILVLRLSLYLQEVRELIQDIQTKFITLFVILFILSLILSYLFSRSISNPIKTIARATEKFSSGDFDTRIYFRNKDEFKDVAENFNSMVEKQKTLFSQLSEKKEELQVVISSMQEGLLVLDCDGKIILFNESFEEIWKATPQIGNFYWEVIRIADFEKFVKRALDSKKNFYEEIEFDNHFILTGFKCTEQGEKLLITFRDITELKRLEKIKKDFIVNLTHELKTPLTTIKGFVETIEEEIKETNQKDYIEIIKRHTNRMNQIIQDLMLLSELEEKKKDLEISEIDLEKIVTNIIKIFKDQIHKKKLKLDLDIDPKLPRLPAERFKIEQLLINLLDNAVKYTEQGKINISASQEGEYLKLQIQDTGIGIPRKSLPRIFERFYVVNKSRSRKLGGTGLGLSIVKHIVQIHSGEISVSSKLGHGTTFTIFFPLTRPVS